MSIFFILAIVALFATVVVMVMGVRSMMHGGEEDNRINTLLMFRRVEFQAAAVGLILASLFLGSGWIDDRMSVNERIGIHLGVLSTEDLRDRFEPDSREARAYGAGPETNNSYLVTVAAIDQASGRRIEDAIVKATVSQQGLSGTTKTLKPASFGGAVTFGNYFRMPKSGMYWIDITVERPGVSGLDMIRLNYRRP